jgi:protein required for attachment to host cells
MESSSISSLQPEAEALRQEIAQLKAEKSQVLEQQLQFTQNKLTQLLQEDLQQLEERKKNLQIAVEQLERRQERIQAEMRETFAGASQELAIRVQGFKDYLVTSLQDVALAAEQLKLVPVAAPKMLEAKASAPKAEPQPQPNTETVRPSRTATQPQFATQSFQEETRQIRRLLEQYRATPNYYGPPWQLRRTFEPIHAERVSKWFFKLGGRGAIRGLGTRLQNILVGSAVISILNELYGERVQTLILANSPESLGDWRRGLQDCLGLERIDFGPDQGVALFESPEALAQKADRLVKNDDIPFILLDDSEETISLAVLQFPLWLAFVPEPQVRRERQPLDWFD